MGSGFRKPPGAALVPAVLLAGIAVFTLRYVTVPAIARSPVLSGLLFGMAVMLVMFYAAVCRRAVTGVHEGIRAPAD